MCSQRRMEIYVRYESPSINKNFESMTEDLFTVEFADYHFDESVFSILGVKINSREKRQIYLYHIRVLIQSNLKIEVKKNYLKNITNQLSDAFTNLPRVTKSHTPAANVPGRVDV